MEITGNGPASEESLDQLSALLGHPLPEDYRAFMRSSGGGRVWPNAAFDFADGSEGSLLDQLYDVAFKKRVCSALPNMIEVFRDDFPSTLLPIGHDPGSNQILLSLQPPHEGGVLFWDHESGDVEDVEEALRRGDLKLVADSFSEFLGALFDDE